MYIDAESTRERIHGRAARNGDEVDAFARDRSEDSYRPGQLPAIKAGYSQAIRTAVRAQLRAYTTI